MTRINCVDVSELHQKHLIAEYRELPRIFTLVKKMIDNNQPPIIYNGPYILGTGHMKFFTTKLTWLNKRHIDLVDEMHRRNYHPTFTESLMKKFSDIPEIWWNDWCPSAIDIETNRARIDERLKNMRA